MTPDYVTVYRISADHINPVLEVTRELVPAIFLTMVTAIAVVVMFLTTKKRGWRQLRWYMVACPYVFCMVWLCVFARRDLDAWSAPVRAYQAGNYQVVEGTVTGFVPMPHEGHNFECFSVQDKRFCYSDYLIAPGFRNAASHGGPIRAGMGVRIAYRTAGRHNTILQLDVARD